MNEIAFKRGDIWRAIIASEIVAALSIPILQNLKILKILQELGIDISVFLFFWALLVPAVALVELKFFHLLAKRKNRPGFWQLGKYGIIGMLNTVLNAGIFNFLIFVTDIAVGVLVDVFWIAAFVITVINSFFWNKYWAFEEREAEGTTSEAIKFFGTSTIIAALNTLLVHLVVNVIGAPAGVDSKIWANVAIAFAIIVATLGNFFAYKFFVFKK